METFSYPYVVLAYYWLEPLANPWEEIALHKEFCGSRDILGRLYLSEQGINGQMSCSSSAADEYMTWMKERFPGIIFKIHDSLEHVFPRLTIKYRKQLVALDIPVDLNKKAKRVSAAEWKKMLEDKANGTTNARILDVRNQYEWKIGHFDGAECLDCETFREFPAALQAFKETLDPKTPLFMCCTGGIRCEFFSPLLAEFSQVYQLDGGIIEYGLQEGSAHWQGKLFVFDDRLAVPLSQEESAAISVCKYCEQPSDTYYNCANMDCNTLFLCCAACLPLHTGCCCPSCQQGERVRPFREDGKNTPFRRIRGDHR